MTVESDISKIRRAATDYAGGCSEVVNAEAMEEANKLWELLGDENFLRLILASDPLGRSNVKIILSPASRRVDKPGMKEPEEIVLTVSGEDDKLRFTVTCHLEIDTGSNEFIRLTQLYLINDVREAEKWASNAYRGEYRLDQVGNGKQIGSIGFAVKLYRVADAEKLARSHPGAVGQWLEAIEKFLGTEGEVRV